MARPRKKLIVADYPPRREGIDYRVQVESARANHRVSLLQVTLAHIDGGQQGRRESVPLPLPVRPEGLTAQFFRACGQTCEIGAEVDEAQTIGREIAVSFLPNGDGVAIQEFKFIGGKYEPTSTAHEPLAGSGAAANRGHTGPRREADG